MELCFFVFLFCLLATTLKKQQTQKHRHKAVLAPCLNIIIGPSNSNVHYIQNNYTSPGLKLMPARRLVSQGRYMYIEKVAQQLGSQAKYIKVVAHQLAGSSVREGISPARQ